MCKRIDRNSFLLARTIQTTFFADSPRVSVFGFVQLALSSRRLVLVELYIDIMLPYGPREFTLSSCRLLPDFRQFFCLVS